MDLTYLANIASLELNNLYDDGYSKIILMNENSELEKYLKRTFIGLVFQTHRTLHDNNYLNFNKFIPYLECLMSNWNYFQNFIFKNNQKMDIKTFFEDIIKVFPNHTFIKRKEFNGYFLFTKRIKIKKTLDDTIIEIHYPTIINDKTIFVWFEYLRALIVMVENIKLSRTGYALTEPCIYGCHALSAIRSDKNYGDLKENYENYFGKTIFKDINVEPILFFNFYSF